MYSPTRAACTNGAPPDYDDIVAVEVFQGRFDQTEQGVRFEFDAFHSAQDLGFGAADSYEAALQNLESKPIARGFYAAKQSKEPFQRAVDILRKDRFFELRLTPSKRAYLDGAHHYIAVTRCGSLSRIGSFAPHQEENLMLFQQVDIQDENWRTFKVVLKDLREMIFANQWTLQPPRAFPEATLQP